MEKSCLLNTFFVSSDQEKTFANHVVRNSWLAGSLPSIDSRPAAIAEKNVLATRKVILFVASKGKGNSATFAERATGFFVAECQTKFSPQYNEAIYATLGRLLKGMVHTVTVDSGTELFGYREIEQTT